MSHARLRAALTTSLAAAVLVAGACREEKDVPANVAAAGAGGTAGGATGAVPPEGSCPTPTGITLPAGFCATIFADSIGHVRDLVFAPNGDLYVNTWSGRYFVDPAPAGAFLIALRDRQHTGKADSIVRFGPTLASGATGGTGIALYKDYVYAEAGPKLVRYHLPAGQFAPDSSAPETIVDGLPLTGDHPMHPFVIDSAGTIYMDVGSATNSCQLANRAPGSLGHKPCTELETRAGIWTFDANTVGQHYSAAHRYVTGLRNAVGIAINPADGSVWSTMHGRDQLGENFPKLYTLAQSAALPAEELVRLAKGADFGWPECYFDGAQKKLVLAPEYGGDGGKAIGPCADKVAPQAFFPAHWAPDGLVFYTGSMFPAHYRGGAFVAFHGSWDRMVGGQQGYNVVFQPFAAGAPSGAYEVFADGFAGQYVQPDHAAHRPTGVAVAPDGALFISDDKNGRIWRVTYTAH